MLIFLKKKGYTVRGISMLYISSKDLQFQRKMYLKLDILFEIPIPSVLFDSLTHNLLSFVNFLVVFDFFFLSKIARATESHQSILNSIDGRNFAVPHFKIISTLTFRYEANHFGV